MVEMDSAVREETSDIHLFEDLLLDLSITFISLPPAEVDQKVGEAQRRVCEQVGLDLSGLWQWRPDDPGDLFLTHLYRPLGGPPVPEPMAARESFPWSLQRVAAGETIRVSSLHELPPEAHLDRLTWEHYGIISSLVFPLRVGGGPAFGALSFNTMRAPCVWSRSLVRRLGLVAQIFASALERKRSEEALRESEQKLVLAADSARAGLWSLDLASRRFWVTPLTLELLGLPPSASLPLDRFLDLVHPADRRVIREKLREVIASGGEGAVEYRVIRPDGKIRWLLSKGRLSAPSSGGLARLMGVTVDISDRKELEEITRDLAGRIITAHEEERARLARELHDDISQRLACMAVELAAVEKSVADARTRQGLQAVRREIGRLGRDVHDLSYRLHPAVLVELGLVEALRIECEQFHRRHRIPVGLDAAPLRDTLPPAASLCLFRVAQESLHNIARHAGAGRVDLALRRHPRDVEIEIRDDGRGFAPEVPARPPALGLSGMRERVRHLGGRLSVASSPGHGTTVRVRLPLNPETA